MTSSSIDSKKRIEVMRAADKAVSALRERDAVIRRVHAEGVTIRAIASAAGLSHSRVHQIIHHR